MKSSAAIWSPKHRADAECPADADPCTQEYCDLTRGVCASRPADNGTTCTVAGAVGGCCGGVCCSQACTCGENDEAGHCQTPFFQGFETNTDGWNAVTRVLTGTNGVPSNGGTHHGEAAPGNFGAFTRWGGYTDVFPPAGYTTAVDIYLDFTPAPANDTRFDWTSAINGIDCAHLRDFVFNAGYYDDSRFYRVIMGFVAQFGIAGDPAIAKAWSQRRIPADKVRERNMRGTIAYAQFKPTDRTTNVFINLRDNPALDTLRFAPVGRVVQGMDVVDSLYAFYGGLPSEEAPVGDPKRLYGESNKYLDEKYPKLDRIVKITIRPDTAQRPR